MRPSFFRSLLPSQSRWQLDRKRNRKRLKDLLLLSFSFKEKCPSDNSPTMLLAWRPLWSAVMRKRRNLKDNCLNQAQKKNKNRKASSFSVSATYSPALFSLTVLALHLREASGFIYPRLEDPCALSGCRVWACFSVAPCCCGREELEPAH